ncbi:MAG: hypothetical protein GKR96_03635 [Gammaproteobacteria bacterium]|nr:hypothetical protein [Gammaproteobacteria bacterium]
MTQKPIVLKVDGATYFEMPLLANYLTEHNIDLIEASLSEAGNVISQHAPKVIVTGATPVGKELMDAGIQHGLRGVVKAGTGLDNVDCTYAESLGLTIGNTPNYVVETVAEYAIGLILALARKVHPVQQAMRTSGWIDITPDWLGMEVHGKTIGLIGFGRIARSLARIAHAGFGMNVLTYDPFVDAAEVTAHHAQKVDGLDEMLSQSDIVSVHTSLNPSTQNLISSQQFAAMKPTALLVNVSRGGIIDEAALLAALSSSAIAGAALDVFAQEPINTSTDPVVSQLTKMDNMLISPHIAWYTAEAGDRLQKTVAQRCHEIIIADTK